MQYQFTLIELHIDKNGKGEGKLVPAAKVSWDTKAKKIEIDNYNALPVDLINVTAKRRKGWAVSFGESRSGRGESKHGEDRIPGAG